MKPVLALDPGKTTGIAFHNGDNLDFGEYDFDATCDYIVNAIRMVDCDIHVVSESFIITQHTARNTQAPWSLELIGVTRYITRKLTGNDITLQSPSSAKRFSSNDRLRHMNYWTPKKGHANDAARHLLLFESTRGYIPKETLLEFSQLS